MLNEIVTVAALLAAVVGIMWSYTHTWTKHHAEQPSNLFDMLVPLSRRSIPGPDGRGHCSV